MFLFAMWVSHAQAGNGTILHGWVPEPDGRGTWSILWSCLVTIFICTWSALHLEVPASQQHDWASLLMVRKVKWMLLAAIAPEYILWTSANDFFLARRIVQRLAAKQVQSQGQQKWTMTHVLFACTGGFWIRTLEGHESRCTPEQLQTMIANGTVEGPPISEDELKSRGKADWTIKLIAILQILWFLLQTLVRAIQHYQITALEIMTVAFVFSSIFTYGFSFQKPQDVEYPIFIETCDASEDREQIRSSRKADARSLIHATSPHKTADEFGTPLHDIVDSSSHHADEEQEEEDSPEQATRAHWRLLTLLGCVFGAIHCLSWNSTFPTSSERLAWRICSVVTTAMPGLITIALNWYILVLLFTSMFCNAGHFFTHIVVPVVQPLLLLAYALGRITIIVLALIGLRALPAGAFQTVNWNKYFPHFAN